MICSLVYTGCAREVQRILQLFLVVLVVVRLSSLRRLSTLGVSHMKAMSGDNREVACNNLGDDDNDDDDQHAIIIIIINRGTASNNLRIVGVLDWCSYSPFMRL